MKAHFRCERCKIVFGEDAADPDEQRCPICGAQGALLDEPVDVQPQRHPKEVVDIDHAQLVSGVRAGELKIKISLTGEFDGKAFQEVYPELKSRLGFVRLCVLPICLLAGVGLLKSMGEPEMESDELWKIALGGLLFPAFLGEVAIRLYRNWALRRRLLADSAFFDKAFATPLIQVRRR